MKAIEFYRDAEGHPRVKGSDERLVIFIRSDLQESESIIQTLIEQLEEKRSSDFVGNAHSVAIRDVTASIESTLDTDAPGRRLLRGELLAVLKDWLAFIC